MIWAYFREISGFQKRNIGKKSAMIQKRRVDILADCIYDYVMDVKFVSSFSIVKTHHPPTRQAFFSSVLISPEVVLLPLLIPTLYRLWANAAYHWPNERTCLPQFWLIQSLSPCSWDLFVLWQPFYGQIEHPMLFVCKYLESGDVSSNTRRKSWAVRTVSYLSKASAKPPALAAAVELMFFLPSMDVGVNRTSTKNAFSG